MRSTIVREYVAFTVVLACSLAGLLVGNLPSAQADDPEIFRHHVIFLIDRSGSIYDTVTRTEYQRIIRDRLPTLLSDSTSHGFDVDSIYDPSWDLSSAFTFGIARSEPFFDPEREKGLLEKEWTYEARSLDDVAAIVPPREERTNWTAYTTALSLAPAKAGLERGGVPPAGVERSFIVMVTDGKDNLSGNQVNELFVLKKRFLQLLDPSYRPFEETERKERRLFREAARENNFDAEDIEEDYDRTTRRLNQVSRYYKIATPPEGSPNPDGVVEIPISSNKKLYAFFRELIPEPSGDLSVLLSSQPNQITVLRRQYRDFYADSLILLPRVYHEGDLNPHDLVRVQYRAPHAVSFRDLEIPSPGESIRQWVRVQKNDMANVNAVFRLAFVHRDPVYGLSIKNFDKVVQFRPEKDARILGLVRLPTFFYNSFDVFGNVSQEASAVILSVISLIILGLILIGLLWRWLFPAPVPGMKILNPTGKDLPIHIDFNRSAGQPEGVFVYPFVFRTIRFVNLSRRPFRWQKIGRLAERRFSVVVSTETERNEQLILQRADSSGGSSPRGSLTGLSATMKPSITLHGIAHHSEVTLGLRPDQIADYLGERGSRVPCTVKIGLDHLHRGLRTFFKLRRDPIVTKSATFELELLPEEGAVETSILPGRDPEPTGETASGRAFADAHVNDDSYLILPHLRDREIDTKVGKPDFLIRLRSTATHFCSVPRDALVKTTLTRVRDAKDCSQALVMAPALIGELEKIPAMKVKSSTDTEVRGIQMTRGTWAGTLKAYIDFDKLDTPSAEGEDYTLEVYAKPMEGQRWPHQRSVFGLRLGPDSREADAKVAVQCGAETRVLQGSRLKPRQVVELAVQHNVRWSIAEEERDLYVIASIRPQNFAWSGKGEVKITLLPDIEIKIGKNMDPVFEPKYDGGSIKGLVFLADMRGKAGTYSAVELRRRQVHLDEVTEPIAWRIPSESRSSDEARRNELLVGVDPARIADLGEERSYEYDCTLPFKYEVNKGDASGDFSGEFSLRFAFTVERWAGGFVLAVDFGTSAVVSAFSPSLEKIQARSGQYSDSTLDLQTRYHQVLEERDRDDPNLNEVKDERDLPNSERGTPFIPSQIVCRPDRRIGDPDFVFLPATASRQVAHPIFYLKSLILRGGRDLPEEYLSGEGGGSDAGLRWKKSDGTAGSGRLPIDGLLQSTYRNLLGNYIENILERGGHVPHLDRIIFSYPNTFSLDHLNRLTGILGKSFGKNFDFSFISESDAVAIYSAERITDERSASVSDARNKPVQYALVYDIGAGTLDITYTRMEWGVEEPYPLKSVEVLFRTGIPLAGNTLDAVLAGVLDWKIRHLKRALGDEAELEYSNPIVDTRETARAKAYRRRMWPVKRAIQQLKIEATKCVSEKKSKFRIQVPIQASFVTLGQEILFLKSGSDEALARHNIKRMKRRPDDETSKNQLLIPLESAEIFNHPSVVDFLRRITTDVIKDIADSLKGMNVKPRLDTLIVSGRTALFPPLAGHLREAVNRHFETAEGGLYEPDFTAVERKEAVALGGLYYSILHGGAVKFIDRNIWGRYGVIYNSGHGARFKEFFGYATRVDPDQGDEVIREGQRDIILFRRSHKIKHLGGRISIALAHSSNPQEDVGNPALRRDRFIVLRSVNSEEIGTRHEFDVEMQIDEKNKLLVTIGQGGTKRLLETSSTSSDALGTADMWPYRPLSEPIPLEVGRDVLGIHRVEEEKPEPSKEEEKQQKKEKRERRERREKREKERREAGERRAARKKRERLEAERRKEKLERLESDELATGNQKADELLRRVDKELGRLLESTMLDPTKSTFRSELPFEEMIENGHAAERKKGAGKKERPVPDDSAESPKRKKKKGKGKPAAPPPTVDDDDDDIF